MFRNFMIVLAAGSLAACAAHREAPEPVASTIWVPPPITQYADADRDGKVTRKEARTDPNLAQAFDKYDANDDGILDRGEFARLEAASRRQTEAMQVQLPDTATTRSRMEPAPRPLTLNRTGIDSLRPESE